MANTPTDIANQALDAIGSEITLGDIQNGSREAQVMLRAYGQCRKQLLRAATWNFARKEAPLQLLADATGAGSIPNVPAAVAPVGSIVPGRFRFSYAYPIDCIRARSVPWSVGGQPPAAGNISLPPVPIMTGLGGAFCGFGRARSARFLVTTDVNKPPAPGQAYQSVQGVSPQGRTVVLTDVPNAWLIYTFDAVYPENWDSMFRAALISYIASEVALALTKDKRLGLQLRSQQIELTKAKIGAARVVDGDENPMTTDHVPDWLAGRYGSGFISNEGFDAAWDACAFADGSSF